MVVLSGGTYRAPLGGGILPFGSLSFSTSIESKLLVINYLNKLLGTTIRSRSLNEPFRLVELLVRLAAASGG